MSQHSFEQGYLVNLDWLHTPCCHPAGDEVNNGPDRKPEDLSRVYFKSGRHQPWKLFIVSSWRGVESSFDSSRENGLLWAGHGCV